MIRTNRDVDDSLGSRLLPALVVAAALVVIASLLAVSAEARASQAARTVAASANP